jgi:magnesium transporter
MHVLTALDRREISELRERGEFFWLDLTAPSDADVEAIGEAFDLDPHAVEAATSFGQRPRIARFGDYVLLVFYGARSRPGQSPELIEVHLFISGDYVVSVHPGHCDPLWQLQKSLPRRDSGSEEYVVFRILDSLADSFFEVLGGIDDEIDGLEDAVVTRANEQQLQRIFNLKRDLVLIRKIVTPQRDLLARAIDDITMLPGFEADARGYFRDVYDHMIRISDLVDSYRDLLSGALDVYLSTVSNRLNSTTERLTVIATIFLPLTFLTGFFGQNFAWMVGKVDTFAAFMVFGVGGIVLAVSILLLIFRRYGWI